MSDTKLMSMMKQTLLTLLSMASLAMTAHSQHEDSSQVTIPPTPTTSPKEAKAAVVDGKVLKELFADQFEEEEPSEYASFVYFATLQGLTRDQVNEDVVKSILGVDMYQHFVFACPVCSQVYAAVKNYQALPVFFNQNRKEKFFRRKGLPEAERKLLLSKDVKVRRKAIRQLVARYIQEGKVKYNLNKEQTAELNAYLEELSDHGTWMLKKWIDEGKHLEAEIKQLKAVLTKGKMDEKLIDEFVKTLIKNRRGETLRYLDWDFCPSCDGGSWHKVREAE